MKREFTDQHLESILARMPIPTAKEDAASEARGRADIAAGRTISHEAVQAWLLSLASGKRLPRPQVGD